MSCYPFQRLLVYSVYPGTSTIQWDLHPNMQDKYPYVFQLQYARTPNMEEAWENIGEPVTNASALEDPNTQRSSFVLDGYYRVLLTTGSGNVFTSMPEGCFGQLHRNEWRLATEILKKEQLLFKNTAVPGVLLQALRSGPKCSHCNTDLVEGVTNSQCPYCYGTGYEGGYHAPFNFQAWQVSPSQLKEIHYSNDVATFNTSVDRYQARATGVPELYSNDIWVDLSTAQRFKITSSQVIAQIRRVPLVRQVDMTLIPTNDMAYKIPIGNAEYDSVTKYEAVGCGTKTINHNYPSTDDLRYVDSKGKPISGALVTITQNGTLLFTTTTNIEGRWVNAYKAELGSYRVTFEKEGSYGPDYADITITAEEYTEEEAAVAEDRDEQRAVDYLTEFPGF